MLYFFYFILMINFIVFLYSWYINIKVLFFQGTIKNIFTLMLSYLKHTDDGSYDNLNFFGKFLFLLILLIICIFILGLSTSMIWIPIVLVIRGQVGIGIIFYVTISVIFLLFDTSMHKRTGIHKRSFMDVEKTVIRNIIQKVFSIQIIIIVLTKFNASYTNLINLVYSSSSWIPNTLTVLFSVFYISIFLISIYMYMKYIYLRFLDNKEKTIWKIRIWEILLIFVLSSFIGLIYISETYMNYIPAELTDSFLVTFETLRFFLGVLLVPIMFKTFEKRSNTFKIREEEIE